MGKEQLYLQTDQSLAVGQAMQLVHEAQPTISGGLLPAVDFILPREEIEVKVLTVPVIAEAESVLAGDKKNLKAPGVNLRQKEKLPPDYEGFEPFRVNGELVMLSEATLDDVFHGNSGYTLRQLDEINEVKYRQVLQKEALSEADNILKQALKENEPLVSEEEAVVLFVEDFLFQYNADRKGERLAIEAAERIISEYQNIDK